MNPLLANILRTKTVTTPSGEQIPIHSQLPELEGRLLQAWLAAHQPKRLLEVGLAYGVSSLFICEAVSAWKVDYYHIVDAFQSKDWQGTGIHHLHQAGYGGAFTFHEQLSEFCLPRFLQQGLRFDFAFVDGWHTFDQVLTEFYYINRMLDVGGLLVFDDVHLPSLQKMLAYVETYDCYKRLAMPPEIRSLVPIKVRQMMQVPLARINGFVKTAVDKRNWDWHEDF